MKNLIRRGGYVGYNNREYEAESGSILFIVYRLGALYED